MKVHALASLSIPSGLGDSAWLLYGLVRARKPQVCVEIGSAQGWSACFTAAALHDNGIGRLIAIDPHTQTHWNDDNTIDTLATFTENIRLIGVQDRVTVIASCSENAALGWEVPIDILFIDGDHSYEGARRDWDLFSPHVSRFGCVIFHDTIWDVGNVDERFRREGMGVPRVVEELRRAGFQVLTLPNDFGLSVVQPTRHGIPLTAPGTPLP